MQLKICSITEYVAYALSKNTGLMELGVREVDLIKQHLTRSTLHSLHLSIPFILTTMALRLLTKSSSGNASYYTHPYPTPSTTYFTTQEQTSYYIPTSLNSQEPLQSLFESAEKESMRPTLLSQTPTIRDRPLFVNEVRHRIITHRTQTTGAF